MSTPLSVIVNSSNPMDFSALSSAVILSNLALSSGLTNPTIWLNVNSGTGIDQMVPESEWAAKGVVLGSAVATFYITFGPTPSSTAWGNYFVVGELLFYMKNQGKTLSQLVAQG